LLLGITRQESLIAGSRAAVRYILHALVRIDDESKRVSDLSTIIQHASSFERGDKRSTQRIRIEHRVPLHPIANRREHAAVSINIHERHVEPPWSIALTRIRLSAAWNDSLVVVSPRTTLH